MRKILIKCAFVFLSIILVPYFLTLLISGESYNSLSEEEEYLVGALAASVEENYEKELLKAQSILLRNYGFLNGFDKLPYIDNSQRREKWNIKYEEYEAKMEQAVRETKNQYITYNNEIIQPYFHEVSTGKTRDGKEAFGTDIPYLRSVNSVEDVTSIDFMKISECTIEEFLNSIFGEDIPNDINKENFFEKFRIEERDSIGYVINIVVGDTVIDGSRAAELLGLNSDNFYIENYNGKVRIICKGKGKGFGLSQYGGNVMAAEGADYKEILKYYFVGTNIEIK